jgi:glycosyltransferase involved in cell wall biosynthesis
MPRLLIVTTVPETIDAFLLPYAEHFRGLGWAVDALTGPGERLTGKACFDRVFSIDWTRNPLDVRAMRRAPRRVREIVAEGAYDIVHVHTPVAAFLTRLSLRHRRRGGAPQVVYTAHGFHFHPGATAGRGALFLALEKLAARWTDYLVVINRDDAAAAERWRFLPPDRVRLMPGIGVDLGLYAPERVSPEDVRALRRSLHLGDQPCVLMVAEFIPRKRHVDLLRAFASIAGDDSLPRAHLLLAGSGGGLEAVRAQARASGLEERTHFLGFRRDVPVLMRASSALVLPSEQEGLPRSVLEAMAMGLPVVGSRIRGTAELLEDGCGFLHGVGDAAELGSLLRRVLLDPASAQAAAARARARVARYDLANVIRLHEELYASALGATGDAL